MKKKQAPPDTGKQAEKLARKWLENQGLHCLQTNWQCRLGEIDLIMLDDDTWVFVEVRYRRTTQFGGALASVTPQKQRKLTAAAGIWLSQQPHADKACRFDVVGMEPDTQGVIQYQWIQHAFLGG